MKFTDEDGETTEENLELKIEGAPVILIPGIFDNAAHTFGSTKNSGVWRGLLKAGFSKEYIDVWEYDRSKSSEELAGRDYDNGLFGVLTAMFNRYAEKGIACTKADIVAHGFGGLLARTAITGPCAHTSRAWCGGSLLLRLRTMGLLGLMT